MNASAVRENEEWNPTRGEKRSPCETPISFPLLVTMEVRRRPVSLHVEPSEDLGMMNGSSLRRIAFESPPQFKTRKASQPSSLDLETMLKFRRRWNSLVLLISGLMDRVIDEFVSEWLLMFQERGPILESFVQSDRGGRGPLREIGHNPAICSQFLQWHVPIDSGRGFPSQNYSLQRRARIETPTLGYCGPRTLLTNDPSLFQR